MGPGEERAQIRYRIGDQGRFLLDPARRELRDRGEIVDVQAKVLDLIVCLVEQRERAVDKHELQDRVWARQVITEAAMTRAIMKARRALDDDADAPAMIRTIHGRGYRFVAPVSVEDAPASLETTAPAVEHSPMPGMAVLPGVEVEAPPGQRSRLALAVMLFAALLLVALLSFGLLRERGEPLVAADIRLAILPVQNRTGSADLDWIELGLMDTMQQALREASDLALVPASVLAERGEDRDGDALQRELGELAREQQATHLLAAQVEQAGGTLQLHVHLLDVDGHSRRRLFAGHDPLVLARAAVNDLLATIGAHADVRDEDARRRTARDPLANEAYVRGRALILQGREGDALEFLALAHRTDPDAYWPALQYAETLRNLDRFDDAAAILSQLVEASVASADARGELGARIALGILERRLGRFDAAHANLAIALGLTETLQRPREGFVCLLVLAQIDLTRERHAAADAWLDRADALNQAQLDGQPDYILLETMGRVALAEGRLDDAEATLQRALALRQTAGNVLWQGWAWHNLALVSMATGNAAQATERATRALALHRESGNQNAIGRSLALLAGLQARSGALEAAAQALDEAQPLLADTESVLDRQLLAEARSVLAFELGESARAAPGLAEVAAALAGLGRRSDAARVARLAALAHWTAGDRAAARDALELHPAPAAPAHALALALLDGQAPTAAPGDVDADAWRWLALAVRERGLDATALPPAPALAGPQARQWVGID